MAPLYIGTMREGHFALTMVEKCRPRPPVINIVVSAYANHSREFSIGVETIVSAPIKLSHPARKEEEMAFLFKVSECGCEVLEYWIRNFRK